MVSLGSIVEEKYRIEKVLGAGGFGCVYKAWHLQLERPVALKILTTSVLEEADGPARFEREARAISALRHKNIVSFYGFGICEQSPYMVMEFVEGTSIQSILRGGKPLAIKESIAFIRQLCDALACAHSNGIVHRDLKPSNLMVTKVDGKECLKIIDFGLAKLMPGYGIAAQKLTETGIALGTCTYMSPEQCIGNVAVDHRTDIYAAGCLLFELLTNKAPFCADDNVALMFLHVNSPIPRLTQTLRESTEVHALQAVIDKAMAKDPEARYALASDMIADLDAIAAGRCEKLAEAGRQAKSNATFAFNAKSLGRMVPLAVLIAAVAASSTLYLYSHMQRSRTSDTALARVLFDKMWIASNRLRKFPEPHGVAAQINLIDRIIDVNEKEHSLTPVQVLQVMREGGKMRMVACRHETAIPFFNKVIDMAPAQLDTFEDHSDLARCVEVAGRWDRAEHEYRWIIKNWKLDISPVENYHDAWLGVARLAVKRGDLKTAEEALTHIPAGSTLKGSVSCAFFFLNGHLKFLRGQPAASRMEYEAGLPTTADDTEPCFQAGIARCAVQMGSKAEYPKLLSTLGNFRLTGKLANCRSVAALQMIMAAELGDRWLVEKIAKRVIALDRVPYDEISKINEWDTMRLKQALEHAGYKDLEEKLQPVFRWVST